VTGRTTFLTKLKLDGLSVRVAIPAILPRQLHQLLWRFFVNNRFRGNLDKTLSRRSGLLRLVNIDHFCQGPSQNEASPFCFFSRSACNEQDIAALTELL